MGGKMFGIGMPELIVIMVIALIVLGPSKLPDLARSIGKALAEFRKATQEIKESLNIEGELKEAKEDLVDSISGLDRPLDLEPPVSQEKEKPEYEEGGDGQGDNEKIDGQSQDEEREAVTDTNTEKRQEGDG
jgi:Tat protein translocase TatB subunit